MNVRHPGISRRSQHAFLLAAIVLIAVGCKDLTSHSQPADLQELTDTPSGSSAAPASPAGEPVKDTTASDKDSAVEAGSADAASARLAPKESTALPVSQPVEVYEPKVVLSESHEETSLVKVGDQMPDLQLKRLNGEPAALKEVLGDQLTLVVFWTNRQVYAREQFERLAGEVAVPFKHLGLKVVAVNVGDPVEQIEVDDVTREEVTCLHDADGSAIAQVATAKLPRTYLLDESGRVLWFDLEYSRGFRRQLKNAIYYYSQEREADAAAS